MYRRGPHPLVTLATWGVVAVAFFTGIYFGLHWLKKHDPSLLSATGARAEKPLARIFFLDLHQRYLDNEDGANRRYTGKVVEIDNQGWDKFGRVETKEGQTALVCFDIDKNSNGPSESPVVLCVFPSPYEKQLARLGKHWIIRGRVSSFDAERSVVVLEDCEVVP